MIEIIYNYNENVDLLSFHLDYPNSFSFFSVRAMSEIAMCFTS